MPKSKEVFCFGVNIGLDFNNGTSVAITQGAMVMGEGCSVISDGFKKIRKCSSFEVNSSILLSANPLIAF